MDSSSVPEPPASTAEAAEKRRVINVALGLVMFRHNIGQDEAMELLSGVSERTGRSLYDVAADYVEHRRI
ncbi:MAG: hypothetical protein QOH56_2802 [Pseudonocardiales bacterium]|nr:hypothetical protein [Pseudonocardiales bacterium]